ncbi:MAG TPA: hypothetical protein VFE94_00435, partial [Candidatus Paceibacterota bacterium]|nr:hypothetical protein [Candidatus Paceibacterota bacterium]
GGASGRFHCGRFGGGFISSDYLSGGGGGGGGSSYVDSAFEVSGSTTHTQGCATCRGAGAVAISYVGLPLPGSTAQDEEFFNIDLTAPTVTNFTASDGTTTVNASNDPLVAMSSPVTLEWGAADAPGGAGLGAQELWQAAYIAGLCDENDISRCSWVQRFTNATSPATDTPPLGKWWYSVRAYDQSLPSGNCITDQGAHCGGTPGPDRLDPRTAIGPILIEMPTIGGLVPCGRQTDSIDTPWNETENCEFRHFFLLARILVDFTLWRAVPLIIAVLLLATGAIFYFSFGGPGAMARVRQIWRAVLLGSLILIFSWLFLNFLLGIIGFDINVFGRWYDVQL